MTSDANSSETHRACASHCCQVHGCKYGYEDCPVYHGSVPTTYANNNGCECCEMDATDPQNIRIAELESLLTAATSRAAADAEDAAIGRLVRSKLISGNCISVERCFITADEVANTAREASHGQG